MSYEATAQICIPEITSWQDILQGNSIKIQDLGPEWLELRQSMRQYCLSLVDQPVKNQHKINSRHEPLLIGTGHQVELFHGGIYEKYLRMNEFIEMHSSKSHVTGIALLLDLDPTGGLALTLPTKSKEGTATLEKIGISTHNQFPYFQKIHFDNDILVKVREALTSISPLNSGALNNSTRHLEALYQLRDIPISDALIKKRKLLFSDQKYSEIKFSTVFSSKIAQQILITLTSDPTKLVMSYNEELDIHRKEHKIENSANPFPNLQRKGTWIELPLWYIDLHEQSRKKVYAKLSGTTVEYGSQLTEDDEPSPISRNLDFCYFIPRGALTSLFFRIFMFDGFIHGLGGKRYDSYTDRLIKRFFQIEAPQFFTVSADYYFSSQQRLDFLEIQNKLDNVRDLYSHPEKILSQLTDPSREQLTSLISERDKIISQLKNPSGQKRSALGKSLASINATVKELIDTLHTQPLRDKLQSFDAIRTIILDRTLPYIYYWS